MRDQLRSRIPGILLIGLCLFVSAVSGAPGDLDTSFSLDGKLTDGVGVPGINYGKAAAIQADGKIIVAGESQYGGYLRACGIVRYNLDGTLDTSFDFDGKVFVPLNNQFICSDIRIQPDGKIVAAGYSLIGSTNYDFGVVRINPDGSLDTSFDGDGKVTTDIGATTDIARDMEIQSDGKIVVLGGTFNGTNREYVVVRYNTDGSLDTSFDGDGKLIATTGFGDFDELGDITIQSDGKIVAVGYARQGVG